MQEQMGFLEVEEDSDVGQTQLPADEMSDVLSSSPLKSENGFQGTAVVKSKNGLLRGSF